MKKEDGIDIVIQGGIWNSTIDSAKSYSILPFVNNVIISTWWDPASPPPSDGIAIVKSIKPDDVGQCNINLQIKSSDSGIHFCESNYILKIRSDQHFYSETLYQMYDYFSKNDKSKIFVHGINGKFPYHPNDHVFMGTKQNMIDLFKLPFSPNPVRGLWQYSNNHFQADGNLDWNHNDLRPNIYIGAHYISNKDIDALKHITYYKDYLVDKAPLREEALIHSQKVLSNYFCSFPKLKLWWTKHNSPYPFDMYEPQGEYYNTI